MNNDFKKMLQERIAVLEQELAFWKNALQFEERRPYVVAPVRPAVAVRPATSAKVVKSTGKTAYHRPPARNYGPGGAKGALFELMKKHYKPGTAIMARDIYKLALKELKMRTTTSHGALFDLHRAGKIVRPSDSSRGTKSSYMYQG